MPGQLRARANGRTHAGHLSWLESAKFVDIDQIATGLPLAEAASRVLDLARLAKAGGLRIELWRSDVLVAWLDPAPPALIVDGTGGDSSGGAWADHVALRPNGGGWLVEVPSGPAQLWLTIDALTSLSSGDGAAAAVLQRLARSAEVWSDAVADDGRQHWSWQDAWFEAACRRPRSYRPRGATWPGSKEDPPAVRPRWPGELLAFPAVNSGLDVALSAALIRRRSVRQWAGPAPTFAQLGGLLCGVLRPSNGRRTWPSGGALYAVEVYVAVAECEGLSPGLYAVDIEREGLVQVASDGEQSVALVRQARPLDQSAPVVVVLAARFQRITNKYEGIAHRLLLLEVGALMQNFQLLAPTFGLSSCAVGSGDVQAFARCSGLSSWTEGSVAELCIGCE